MKRALRNVPLNTEIVMEPFKMHSRSFPSDEGIRKVQTSLLSWYDTNKRSLQWRDLSQHEVPNIRAYSGIP
jgi:adenine-specific DNA glycosylase